MAEPGTAHHRLTTDRRLGSLHLQADLSLHAPWTLLFGPSGSGKSSLLRATSGLLGAAGVRLSRTERDGRVVPLIEPSHATPTHRLRLGYAPQQGSLFPHLNVAANVAFAGAVQGSAAETRGSRKSVSNELLDLFEIAPLADRLPRRLSGGERQRVNLARAFAVPGVRLLLLDEPFNGIGRATRDRLLARMLAWTRQHEVPVLSVSHDVDEALLLGAEVVVLDEGKVIRRGPAFEALAAERDSLAQALRQP